MPPPKSVRGKSGVGLDSIPFLYFEEYLTIPGLEDADIRLEFDSKPSLEEVEDLRRKLKRAGLVFVVQRGAGATDRGVARDCSQM